MSESSAKAVSRVISHVNINEEPKCSQLIGARGEVLAGGVNKSCRVTACQGRGKLPTEFANMGFLAVR